MSQETYFYIFNEPVSFQLDILTGNEHRKTSKVIEEQKSSRRDDQIIDFAFNENQNSEVDFDSLRSLSEAGIDDDSLRQNVIIGVEQVGVAVDGRIGVDDDDVVMLVQPLKTFE